MTHWLVTSTATGRVRLAWKVIGYTTGSRRIVLPIIPETWRDLNGNDGLNWRGEFRVVPDDRLPAHLGAPGNTAQHWTADTTRIRDEVGFRETITREKRAATGTL
jgi:hypothetical protein